MLDNYFWVVCLPRVLVTFETRNPGIVDKKPKFHFLMSLFGDDFGFKVCNFFTDRCINCVCIAFFNEILSRVWF